MVLLNIPGGASQPALGLGALGNSRRKTSPESDYNPIMQSSPDLFPRMDEFVYICILFYLIICIDFKLKELE